MRILFFWIGLFFLVAGGAGTFLVGQAEKTDSTSRTSHEENLSHLVPLTFEIGQESFSFLAQEGVSVLEAMEAGGIEFSGKDFLGLGFFVEEIGGKRQDPKKQMYWVYYINGEAAQVGVSQYRIQPNDKITWRYEKAK